MKNRIKIKQYVNFKHEIIEKVIPLFNKVIGKVKWDTPVRRSHSDKYYQVRVSISFAPKKMSDVFKGALDVVLKNGELYYYIYIDTLNCGDFTRYDEALFAAEGFVSKTDFDKLQEQIIGVMCENYTNSKMDIAKTDIFEITARKIILHNVLYLKNKYNISTIGIRNDVPYGCSMNPSHTLCLYGITDEETIDKFYKEYLVNYWDKFQNAGGEYTHANFSLSDTIEYESHNMRKSERSQYQYII